MPSSAKATAGQRKPAKYDHLKIEKKWQKEWQDQKTYHTENPSKKKKMYVLDMFPYPSGAGLHVGHPRGYIASDVYARMKRMEGFNVLHPMGFDSFGLPAEQYAIQTKKHPGPFTDKLVAQYKKQLEIIGFSYDWSREVSTHRPEYYKWTQWIFLKLYDGWYDSKKNQARTIEELVALFEKSGNKNVSAVTDGNGAFFSAKEWKSFSVLEQQNILMHYRLAYEGFAEVNWCEELGTVLANDEIVDGPNGPVSERGGYPVIKKPMRQWFMRITAYADRLAKELVGLDWPNNIKEIQKNWIGKSEGLLFTAQVKDLNFSIQTFSAHFEACYADTFVVIAPDHPLLKTLVTGLPHEEKILQKAQEIVIARSHFAEGEYKEIEGIFTGRYIVDPLGNGDLPIWVASFALANYGTGIVKCSCHDERDFAFAKKYNIPLKPVLFPTDKKLAAAVKNLEVCFTDASKGILSEPAPFKGKNAKESRAAIIDYLEKKGFATRKVHYKMRDAIFARQRYWGEPIPLRHQANGLIVPLKEKELPLELPKVKSYEPSGNGESPLASVKDWLAEGYETNTMPGWAGSSWYFLRYMDPTNTKAFAGKKAVDYWQNVDMYVGGAEHATGHLLYSRFWHKFLYDMKYVPTVEPFKALRNQGLIGGADGRKMSKRWGNVINPDEVVSLYGADSLRVFEMFLGPFESHLPWSTEGIIGSRRFIERIWRFSRQTNDSGASSKLAEKVLHKTIKKVTEDIQTFSFNTAVSSLMICLNEFEKTEVNKKDFDVFLQLLAPFAPYVTEELWDGESSIHRSAWPKHNPKFLIEDIVTIGVQINGKVRGEIAVPLDASKESIEVAAYALPRIQEYMKGHKVNKVIVIPGKVINIVLQ